ILGRDADYVLLVKGNMPTLYRQLKKLPWAAIPATSSVSTGHGRRARRTIKVVLAPAWIGGHWHIENKLHWVRDVTYQEDRSLVRTGNAPRVMATLRSLAISLLRLDGHNNIAAANRHHARDPQRTLKLLQAA